MVSGAQGVAAPLYYGPVQRPGVSEEQMALVDFAWRLGSSNCTSEGPIGSVDETRQDAELLMSLLLSPRPTLHSDDEIPESEPVSSSSERSYSSESSCMSSSRREVFSFTCPSLSLENPCHFNSSGRQTSLTSHSDVVCTSNNNNNVSEASQPLPALLLGRPLKVDDRDALRLSADAMARNVLQSFQKAMNWRVQVWMEDICNHLANKEKIMLQDGATLDEIKKLLETPEAALVVMLRTMADEHKIVVNSVNTSFQVLPQRVDPIQTELPQQQERRNSMDSTSTSSSLSHEEHQGSEGSSLRESDYLYTVMYKLEFTCDVYVEAPAGLTEITLKVPGTIEGNFFSNETDAAAELQSVKVNVDTDCLAKMVEKGCRTVVRTSVENGFTQVTLAHEAEEFQDCAEKTSIPDAAKGWTSTEELLLSSPNAYTECTALVTPRNGMHQDYEGYPSGSVMSNALFPIPDDFSGSSRRAGQMTPPPPPLATLPIKRTIPLSSDQDHRANKRRLPLISPPGNYTHGEFHAVKEGGPSLPMLVEAACRAMN